MNEQDLINAVRRHAMDNYETDGWDYLVECWGDGDILEIISDSDAKTEAAAIKACRNVVRVLDERRSEVRAMASW